MTVTATQSSSGIFSLHGQGLKLTSNDDAAPYCSLLDGMGQDVTEIHLGGNTLGVEACRAFADVIRTKKQLKVSSRIRVIKFGLVVVLTDAPSTTLDR